MICPKCHATPLRPHEFFKLAHGAGPVMVQCNKCYASLTWMNRKPLAAFAGLASFAVATVVGVAGEILAEQVDLIFKIAVPVLCAMLTYAALSYRAWSRVVVRPSTLADLQSVPDAAAREMRTEETLFSYIYIAILLLAIGLTLLGAAGSRLAENIQKETEVSENVYLALGGGAIFLTISVLIFRFRKRMAEATLENLHRKNVAWKALYASMGAEMVIQNFQNRRKRLVPFALVPMLLGIVAIALSLAIHGFEQTKWAEEEVAAVVAGFMLFGCGTIFLGVTFHCPVCLEPPWAAVPGAGRGMTLDPISCPTCGTPLKPEGILIEGEIESLDSEGTLGISDIVKFNDGTAAETAPATGETPASAAEADAPKNTISTEPAKDTKPVQTPTAVNKAEPAKAPKPSGVPGTTMKTSTAASSKTDAPKAANPPKNPVKPNAPQAPKTTGGSKPLL